jgi:hypothetical protein
MLESIRIAHVKSKYSINNSCWKKTNSHSTFYAYNVNYLDMVVVILLFTKW